MIRSPYPWHYTLRWPYYGLFPSARRRSEVVQAPLAGAPLPEYSGVTAKVVLLGDLMCMPGDRVPACDPAVRALLEDADLVVANCEAPVVRRAKNDRYAPVIRFSMASDFLRDFFARFGVEPRRCALSVANNHIGDRGPPGLRETLDRLRALGAAPFGQIEGTEPVTVVRAGGLRLGLLAWTQWLNNECFGEGEGVLRPRDAEARLGTMAASGCDAWIAYPHWEYEFQHFPGPETRGLAARVARAGAAAVVGHHPHVVQPLEEASGSLLAYSLGNWFGPPPGWPCKLVAALELRLAAEGAAKGRVASYRLHPFVQAREADGERIAALDHAPPKLRAKMTRRMGLLFPTA